MSTAAATASASASASASETVVENEVVGGKDLPMTFKVREVHFDVHANASDDKPFVFCF